MNNFLLNSTPLIVLPELACAVGLNEAIVLQQVHYWIEHNRRKGQNFYDGRYWVYNSFEKWQEEFPFWCLRTVKATFSKLENKGLLLSGCFNKLQVDRTKWYTIDYENLEKLIASPSCKSCTMDSARFALPIPENTNQILNTKSRNSKEFRRLEQKNFFEDLFQSYGERAKSALEFVDWYIDVGYPQRTGRPHPPEDKDKRALFAKKLLDFSSATVEDDEIAFASAKATLQQSDGDPTIYFATTPRVLGYGLLKLPDGDYSDIKGTDYATGC